MADQLATVGEAASLPALIDRASLALAGARTAAEVLDAKILASVAYDEAKRIARLTKAREAHDSINAAALRAQADANEIIAAAQRHMADEYDAAQASGEVAARGDSLRRGPVVPVGNVGKATAADVGLSRKDIHEARQARDAEKADPGVTRRALDAMLERGEEPTRAALNRELRQATNRPVPQPTPRVPKPAPGEAFARFLKLADGLEAIGARDLLAAVRGHAPQRAQLGQRASGLAGLMEDIAEGLLNA